MSPDTPQFSTAEYTQPGSGISGVERCRLCSNPLSTEYYRVRGQPACASCAASARNAGGASAANPAAFTRALLLGLGAAIVGLIAYAGFTIATGLYVGYVALGVGYLVAKAMKIGSGGLGGRPYQIAAVIFTYLSIALAEIPIGLWHFRSQFPASRLLVAGVRFIPNGLMSPFLQMRNPVHGLIGAVILFVGLSIAWRGTAASPLSIEGPFRLTPAAS